MEKEITIFLDWLLKVQSWQWRRNLEQGNYMEAYKYEMMVKILELSLYSHLEPREYMEPITETWLGGYPFRY